MAVRQARDAAAVSALLLGALAATEDPLTVSAAVAAAPFLELGLVWALVRAHTHLDALNRSPGLTAAMRQAVRRYAAEQLDAHRTRESREAYLRVLRQITAPQDDPEAVAQVDDIFAHCFPKSSTAAYNRTHAVHAVAFLAGPIGVTPERLTRLLTCFWDHPRIVADILQRPEITLDVVRAGFALYAGIFPTQGDPFRRGHSRGRFLDLSLAVPGMTGDAALLAQWWTLALTPLSSEEPGFRDALQYMVARGPLPDRAIAIRALVDVPLFSPRGLSQFFRDGARTDAIDRELAERLLLHEDAAVRQAAIAALATAEPPHPLAPLPPTDHPEVWAAHAAWLQYHVTTGTTSALATLSSLSSVSRSEVGRLLTFATHWARVPSVPAAADYAAAVAAEPLLAERVRADLLFHQRLVQLRDTVTQLHVPAVGITPAPVSRSPGIRRVARR